MQHKVSKLNCFIDSYTSILKRLNQLKVDNEKNQFTNPKNIFEFSSFQCSSSLWCQVRRNKGSW